MLTWHISHLATGDWKSDGRLSEPWARLKLNGPCFDCPGSQQYLADQMRLLQRHDMKEPRCPQARLKLLQGLVFYPKLSPQSLHEEAASRAGLWLKLQERSELRTHLIVRIGRIGFWAIYYTILVTRNPQNSIGNLFLPTPLCL